MCVSAAVFMSLTASGRGDGKVLCQSQVEALNFKFELLAFFFFICRSSAKAPREMHRRGDSNDFESTARLDGEAQGANVAATKQQRRFKGRFDATDGVWGRAAAACRAVINKSHQCHYCLVGRQSCIILS